MIRGMDKKSYKLLLKLLLTLLLSVGVFCYESFSAPKESVKKVAQVQKAVSKSVKDVAKQAKVPAKNATTQKSAQKKAPAKANTKAVVSQRKSVKRLPTLTKSTMFVKPAVDKKKNPAKLRAIKKTINALEVLYNEAEQGCAATAYLTYVEQTTEVPTKLDGAYNAFQITIYLHSQQSASLPPHLDTSE